MKKLLLLFTVLAFIGCKEEKKEDKKEEPKEEPKEEVLINEDDAIFIEGLYYQKQDTSLVNGTIKSWYNNGQLRWEETWKDGKEDGISKTWYENGQLEYEETYKDGELISEKEWDKDGNEQ